jgi:hypothetical protein
MPLTVVTEFKIQSISVCCCIKAASVDTGTADAKTCFIANKVTQIYFTIVHYNAGKFVFPTIH